MRTVCVAGKEEVGFLLTFRAGRSTDRLASHVVFKLLELLVCLFQHRKLLQAAAKSRLPVTGGPIAADAQSWVLLRLELRTPRPGSQHI